ncbi:MAG: hypothetical protein PHU83_01110 [Eubacteriales bacterium]|nr:hypothetical protein [Eubacteriales bacterium]
MMKSERSIINPGTLSAFLFLALALLEVLAYQRGGGFEISAALLWMFTGVLAYLFIVYIFLEDVVRDIKDRTYFGPMFMAAIIVILVSVYGNMIYSDINPDAVQQTTAGLKAWGEKGFRYTGSAFLGYPARQYLLSALPSLVAGRSFGALHAGFGLPVIFGMAAFYAGMKAFIRRRNHVPGHWAVIAVAGVTASPFFVEYYLNFEQAIFPVAFTLQATGLILMLFYGDEKPPLIKTSAYISLFWTGCMLGTSYTPGLAGLGLLMFFLCAKAAESIAKHRSTNHYGKTEVNANMVIYITMVLSMFIFAYLSLKSLSGTHSGAGNRLAETDLAMFWENARNGISGFWGSAVNFYKTKDNFWGILALPLIPYMILSLTGVLRFRDFVISGWSLAVFGASFALKGYTSYQTMWLMQRGLLVVPVLIAGLVMCIIDFSEKRESFGIVRLCMCLRKNRSRRSTVSVRDSAFPEKVKPYASKIAAMSLTFLLIFSSLYWFNKPNQSFVYFNHVGKMKILLEDLQKRTLSDGVGKEDVFSVVLITNQILLHNLGDYSTYLYPNSQALVFKSMDEFAGLPEQPVKFYVYSIGEYIDVPEVVNIE